MDRSSGKLEMQASLLNYQPLAKSTRLRIQGYIYKISAVLNSMAKSKQTNKQTTRMKLHCWINEGQTDLIMSFFVKALSTALNEGVVDSEVGVHPWPRVDGLLPGSQQDSVQAPEGMLQPGPPWARVLGNRRLTLLTSGTVWPPAGTGDPSASMPRTS